MGRYQSVVQNADLVLLKQLSHNSTPYRDPLAVIDWARIGRKSWRLLEAAPSRYGLAEYEGLPEETRQSVLPTLRTLERFMQAPSW